jgi:hypothetical protein
LASVIFRSVALRAVAKRRRCWSLSISFFFVFPSTVGPQQQKQQSILNSIMAIGEGAHIQAMDAVGEAILKWADPENKYRGYTEVSISIGFLTMQRQEAMNQSLHLQSSFSL